MSIRWSPGCLCCEDDPPCTMIHKELSTDGSTFNTTDWSEDSGPGDLTINGVDDITITNATITPLFTMGSNAAYYIRFKWKVPLGTNTQIKVHMGSNTSTIDLNTQTCTMNSETARPLPDYDNDDWSLGNTYFCPTHTMAECQMNDILGASYPDYADKANGVFYGATVVDSTNPTVTQSWTLEVVGTATLSMIEYRPADVTYSGAIKTQDCGRHDLFPCYWEFWKDLDFYDNDDGTQSVNLTLTGTDCDLVCPAPVSQTFTDRFWGSSIGQTGPHSNEPLDHYGQSPTSGSFCTNALLSYRTRKRQDGSFNWYTSYGCDTFGVEISATYGIPITRAMPTSGTPYPEPLAYKQIRVTDGSSIGITSTSLGSIPKPIPTFTVSATAGGTTVEWDFPWP